MSTEKITALIAEARTWTRGLHMESQSESVTSIIDRLADALEASVQEPAVVDREALARAIHEVDYYGLNLGEKITRRSYATADAILASGVLQDTAEVRSEALEATAEDIDTYDREVVSAEWLRQRAAAVREGRA